MKTRLNKPFGARPHRVTLNLSPTRPWPRPIRLAKILVPIDFSPCSLKALHYAVPLARHFGARIILLHVVEPIIYPVDYGYGPVTRRIPNDVMLKKTWARLNSLGKSSVGVSHLDETLVRTGVASVEIAEVAKSLGIDLILLGTHGCTAPNESPRGSTSEKVVRHAPCPVFVVRQKEHEFV